MKIPQSQSSGSQLKFLSMAKQLEEVVVRTKKPRRKKQISTLYSI
jgi:hypothetical protein